MAHAPGFLAAVNRAKENIQEIAAGDLPAALAKNPKAVLVDVREDREFNAGHVDGAIHLGKGVIERDIEAQVSDKDTTLYLYCGGGFRSALAADALRQMGYQNPVSVDGGWRDLKEIMPIA